jgi:hypothetical protein
MDKLQGKVYVHPTNGNLSWLLDTSAAALLPENH